MDEIVAEAGDLLASGVKELVLIAQDLTDYAQDTNPGGENLAALLGRLAGLDGLFWLRMLYLYPKGITPELLKTIRDIGKPILPYFDIPLQHSHPKILKSMGRPFAADPERTCDAIREVLPDAALRTTLIVGYPGETDAQFQHLCDFVERMRFTQRGVFTDVYKRQAGNLTVVDEMGVFNDVTAVPLAENKAELRDRDCA